MAGRTWLAVILACMVWFTYVQWFVPPPPPKPTQPVAAQTGTPTDPSGTVPTMPTGQQAFSIPPPALKPVHEFKNGKLELEFSSAGGRISDAAVTGYRETIKKDAPPIHLVRRDQSGYDLSALFTDESLKEFGGAEYQGRALADGYLFEHENATARITKTYKADAESHFVRSDIQLVFKDTTQGNRGYLILPVGGRDLKFDHNHPLESWQVAAYINDTLTRKNTDQLSEGEMVFQGASHWLGFGNRYFSTALINESALNPDVVLVKRPDFQGAFFRYPLQLKPDQKEIAISYRTYIGPKDYAILSTVPGMRQLIDYGTFSFLAYPLLELLRFFYKFVHNYGVAIILLTLLVRLLFYPLSVKSARSMKAMQRLQPQIQALKEKYKDDTQRFNQEQMALFKAHKVNPLGGCLPMLIQLPVFFALYSVLGNSIELFHAPFFGWVQDLSGKDPYYVFPILMGISMFFQQKMTPMAGMDPMQQKMMMIMPVVFSFIMINLPSGLTVYIFLSTLLGIGQQLIINREHAASGVTLATAKEPAKS